VTIFRLTHNFEVYTIRRIRLIFLTLAVITCSGDGPNGPGEEEDSFWEQTNGPSGGNVNSFAINSVGDLFAVTWRGGIFRSTDNGDSWTEAKTGLASTRVNSLAINSSGDIFAGTSGYGVFRSVEPTI